jgi:hypothetical protein
MDSFDDTEPKCRVEIQRDHGMITQRIGESCGLKSGGASPKDHDGADSNEGDENQADVRLVEEPSFETLLDTLGHFGRYQVRIFVLLTASDIMNAMIMMYLVFGPATPKWRCAAFEGENSTVVTNGTLQNETFEGTCEYNGSKCVRFDFDKDYTSIVTEVR